MRLRLKRSQQIALAIGTVAALWFFGVFPFSGAEPLGCANGARAPAAQLSRCWHNLTDAFAQIAGSGQEIDSDDPDELEGTVPEAFDGQGGAFAMLETFIDEMPLGWALPALFDTAFTMTLAGGESRTLTWPAQVDDARILLGRLAVLEGQVSATVAVTDEEDGLSNARSEALTAAAPTEAETAIKIAVVMAQGGQLRLACRARVCAVRLGPP